MAKKAGHTRRSVTAPVDSSGGANPADAPGADINKIMAKFKQTGTLPNVGLTNPLYGDFTFPDDIHSMREAVHRAEDRFMDLPADVRSVCKNDWVTFYDLFNTEDGQEILTGAGLIIGTPQPDPAPEPIPEPSPASTDAEPEPNPSP